MTDSNLPDEGTATDTALSFDDGVEALADLIADSENPNPGEKVEARNEAEAAADEPEETEGEGAEDEADDDGQEPDSDEDGPGEVKGGRFAPDTAKVTLKDGTVISVQDLKRGFMSQQSFTRSTTEVAAKRKELEQHEATITRVAQELKQQRDLILQAASQFLPQPPSKEMRAADPIGYMEAKEEYEEKMRVLTHVVNHQKAQTGQMTAAEREQQAKRRDYEAQRLVEVMPELSKPKVYETFWSEATSTIAEHYGFPPEELAQVATDHRLYPMMRDLVRFHKALKRAPQVKQDMQAKPKVMGAGRRMDPKAKTSREAQARREALRQTGTFEAGVAALMDLDL